MTNQLTMPPSYWEQVRTFEQKVFETSPNRMPLLGAQKSWLGGTLVGSPTITSYNGIKRYPPLGVTRIVSLYSGSIHDDEMGLTTKHMIADLRPDRERLSAFTMIDQGETMYGIREAAAGVFSLALNAYLDIPSESVTAKEEDYETLLNELERGASGDYDA